MGPDVFSYSYAITRNHFLIKLWCEMKSELYMTISNNQLNGWTEKLQSPSQRQICTKKRSGPLFGGLLQIWFTPAFWIPVKPLHLISMLSKSLRCTENCSPCSRQSTERAQFFFMTMPDSTLHNQFFKSWMNWATKFCVIHHIHLTSRQLATTSFKHLSNFLQGKHFHDQQEAESAFQEFAESQCTYFYATK